MYSLSVFKTMAESFNEPVRFNVREYGFAMFCQYRLQEAKRERYVEDFQCQFKPQAGLLDYPYAPLFVLLLIVAAWGLLIYLCGGVK